MITISEQGNTRKPFFALLLSIGATGLGHIYCGKIAKGLTLFFISFAFAPVIAVSMEISSSILTLTAVIASILVLVSVFFYALADAWMLAKRTGQTYQLKEYNRWYIYLLFIVVSISYPSNLSNHIRKHIIQAYKIPSSSMSPGILKGDYVFLNKTIYKKQSPQRGESVIFTYPNDRHIDFLKRIVAMPGDSVEIKDHVLIINDIPLDYNPVDRQTLPWLSKDIKGEVKEEVNGKVRYKIIVNNKNHDSADFEKRIVPNGYCFVLGNNRTESKDSRHFGPVPLADIKGRVDYIYLPAGSWSRFGRYKDLQL